MAIKMYSPLFDRFPARYIVTFNKQRPHIYFTSLGRRIAAAAAAENQLPKGLTDVRALTSKASIVLRDRRAKAMSLSLSLSDCTTTMEGTKVDPSFSPKYAHLRVTS